MLSIGSINKKSSRVSLLTLSLLGAADAHSVFMCILPGVNQVTAYAGTYHTGSKAGGMIIAGGVPSSEQYDPICPKPYPQYSSGSYAGEVPAGCTANGAHPWGCGQRFNWEAGAPLTFSQLLAEAPTANCDQIGNSATYYTDISSPVITWNKVTIPVDVCDATITYALITTSDLADDTPWMNIWAEVKCIAGDVTKTPDDKGVPCEIAALTCPAAITANADAQCQARVNLMRDTTYSINTECGTAQLSQTNSLFNLGTANGLVSLTTGDGSVTGQCETSVTVVDTAIPVQKGGVISSCLWPPNHKYMCYENVIASMIQGSDNCDSDVDVIFRGCNSNQADNSASAGDGNTSNDCLYDNVADTMCYRAERDGTDSNGRTYTSLFDLVDNAGNIGEAKHTVFVPHDGDSIDTINCDVAKSSYKGKPNRNLRS